MEAHRITEVFAMHGNEMTWEAHLAVVEHLEKWPINEIVDFHESLFAHLIDGTWVRTSVNRTIERPDGSSTSRQEPFTGPGGEMPPSIPEGHIGLPLHPWTNLPGDGRSLRPAAVRRALDEAAGAPTQSELEWLLRPAAWAYRRSTGRSMPGIPVSYAEAMHVATQPHCYWARQFELSRGDERVRGIRLYLSWTGEDGLPIEGFVKFARRVLGAAFRELGAPLRVDGSHLPGVGADDGQLVWRGPASPKSGSNQLLRDLQNALHEPKSSAPSSTLLTDNDFWSYIDALGENHDDWAALTAALSRKGKATIIGFHEALAAKLYSLDLPEMFATDDDEMPMSSDVFLYVRCAVVARGRNAYEGVLAVGSLRQEEWGEGEAEELLSVAPSAFERRTGEYLEHETTVSYETGSNSAWGESASERDYVGYTVRSVHDGIEELRFWRTDDEAVAIERHRASASGDVDTAGVFGLINYMTLPTALVLSGVHYIRAVPS